MELSSRQKKVIEGKLCPYCGNDTELVDMSEIYDNRKYKGMNAYRCKPCYAHVGCHKGTAISLGRVATYPLRMLKRRAHDHFDPIWKKKKMTRSEAYEWLSEQLGIPKEYTHIGYFGDLTLIKVIRICKEYMATNGITRSGMKPRK